MQLNQTMDMSLYHQQNTEFLNQTIANSSNLNREDDMMQMRDIPHTNTQRYFEQQKLDELSYQKDLMSQTMSMSQIGMVGNRPLTNIE
jgi:hypothetical protein